MLLNLCMILACVKLACSVGLLVAGVYLRKLWLEQPYYDATQKPYSNFSDVLEGDPYLDTASTAAGTSGKTAPCVHLHFSDMLQGGVTPAVDLLTSMAESFWPPSASKVGVHPSGLIGGWRVGCRTN